MIKNFDDKEHTIHHHFTGDAGSSYTLAPNQRKRIFAPYSRLFLDDSEHFSPSGPHDVWIIWPDGRLIRQFRRKTRD